MVINLYLLTMIPMSMSSSNTTMTLSRITRTIIVYWTLLLLSCSASLSLHLNKQYQKSALVNLNWHQVVKIKISVMTYSKQYDSLQRKGHDIQKGREGCQRLVDQITPCRFVNNGVDIKHTSDHSLHNMQKQVTMGWKHFFLHVWKLS